MPPMEPGGAPCPANSLEERTVPDGAEEWNSDGKRGYVGEHKRDGQGVGMLHEVDGGEAVNREEHDELKRENTRTHEREEEQGVAEMRDVARRAVIFFGIGVVLNVEIFCDGDGIGDGGLGEGEIAHKGSE